MNMDDLYTEDDLSEILAQLDAIETDEVEILIDEAEVEASEKRYKEIIQKHKY